MNISLFEVVYVYASLLICTRMSISVHIHSIYVSMYVCAYLFACMYTSVCMHVYTCDCTCFYTCGYIWVWGCSWWIDLLLCPWQVGNIMLNSILLSYTCYLNRGSDHLSNHTSHTSLKATQRFGNYVYFTNLTMTLHSKSGQSKFIQYQPPSENKEGDAAFACMEKIPQQRWQNARNANMQKPCRRPEAKTTQFPWISTD